MKRATEVSTTSPQVDAAEEPPRASAVAVFDLDGTLVEAQTQLLLIRFLRRAGRVSRRFLMGAIIWFMAYRSGLVKATARSRRKGATVLEGLGEHEVRELMGRFAERELLPRLFPPALAALQEHQAEGDRVVIVSAALEPLVEALCERLGVADFAGASCEVVAGHYTGRMCGAIPYGEEKAQVARRLLQEWGADPADCFAYADHETDLPLLLTVGHPVAVRPRPALRSWAEQQGWAILG